MAEPLRNDQKLTTADLARGARPADPMTPRQAERRERGTVGERRPEGSTALFSPEETERFRSEWTRIQSEFVDQPRPSVEQADVLVTNVMKRLAEIFAQERATLEHQWHGGGDISTEELRVALQRYRSFFTRLLSV